MMPDKPAFVLAAGAWHEPSVFDDIRPALEAAGHAVSYIYFPSIFQTSPPVLDLEADVQAVRDVVQKHFDEGRDVVVCAHSWSGAPVCSALEGYGKKEREAQGQANGVVKLVFISAFVVPVGVSLFDAFAREVPPLWNIEGDWITTNNAIDAFYNDLDPAKQKLYESRLKPHARATFYNGTTGTAYVNIPSTFLICELDNAIAVQAQEAMVKGAQQRSTAEFTSERFETGHTPFLSKPRETADFLLRAAADGSPAA